MIFQKKAHWKWGQPLLYSKRRERKETGQEDKTKGITFSHLKPRRGVLGVFQGFKDIFVEAGFGQYISKA